MFRKPMFLAATTLASCLLLGAANAADPLSVMSFGGAYQDAQRKAVFSAYAEETGRAVSEQEYGGEIAKIKAMIDSGNTTIDVVDVDAPTLLQGCDEGIFETIDWEKIGPKSEWLAGTTSDCGVGTIVYATVLSYDEDKLEKAPTKLADLFDLATFPGKRGLWKNPATNLEFALLADGVPSQDVYATLATPDGLDRAFAKLDTIKDQIVWWEAGAQAPQLLASGEVTMTTAWNGRIFNANKEGRNFGIVWDNQILDSNYWVIPKGAKDVEGSLAFIRFAVEPKVLAGIAKYIPYGPVRSTAAAEVAPEDARNLPTSPANLTTSLTLDNAFWADHGDEIRKRFTTWLSN
ncbi:ABC transporter substrate-binding protein [Shinella yambaruensis]|uniref:ABC transporter substrate-binding protein n=1 Tax=Shinella yambaruensis TaxID=415996 RepID=A0ABQ5ZSE9_9HYPH|nr:MULTISPECIES: ABC transporter substrate-binding protein [Shinella]CAI0334980.1 ABC transporter, periplasmic spermidine putrescine-binding protein potD (TC_3.A.1.11.1) [Rhizobiaceae bacterium]CAK7260399.1 Gamma-aminobutyric acid-binding protein [Shinella sp. WSC3-e]MCJ8028836.1 ABC transporter substrate-binding protein [Shinella yambaruensis]MCO5139728.1 ABC transporter substrate-binding protein [Shinella sp.]MCU7981892.1 ABC transporter substrate-binding protein [Shinella yambaruensis]